MVLRGHCLAQGPDATDLAHGHLRRNLLPGVRSHEAAIIPAMLTTAPRLPLCAVRLPDLDDMAVSLSAS